MLLADVNVLVYAHRNDVADHRHFREWWETQIGGPEPFGLAELVLSSFVRIVTNPRFFFEPTPLTDALSICRSLLDRQNIVIIRPGEHHWQIFDDLCRRANIRGDLVSDAYLAALAIESDCEWITLDRDFARFPGLRWRTPF